MKSQATLLAEHNEGIRRAHNASPICWVTVYTHHAPTPCGEPLAVDALCVKHADDRERLS